MTNIQRCELCDSPTGRCEEDALTVLCENDDVMTVCEDCYDEAASMMSVAEEEESK